MDAAIYPCPLQFAFDDIADDLEKSGRDKQCGGCGKPFTAARKYHSIGRVRFGSDIGLLDWSWPLCRKCAREVKRNGGRLPDKLKQQAFDEGMLLLATPGGVA